MWLQALVVGSCGGAPRSAAALSRPPSEQELTDVALVRRRRGSDGREFGGVEAALQRRRSLGEGCSGHSGEQAERDGDERCEHGKWWSGVKLVRPRGGRGTKDDIDAIREAI